MAKVELRKENRIKTIRGTVAIEGNTLTESQVTAILEGKPVIGSPKEITEVKNAAETYAKIKTFNVYSLNDLRKAHKMLMKDLIPDAGQFRREGVGIVKPNGVSHVAPPAHLVPTQMAQLFSFLKKDKEYHPLLKASAFHYELEFIHPFSDGNGRVGRLWEHAYLMEWNPLFEVISIEALVKEHQAEYYAALEQSDRKGSSEDFIVFNLGVILEALEVYFAGLKAGPVTSRDRLKVAGVWLGSRSFTRKEYMALFKTLSTATASRDLRLGVDTGLLIRTGDKRNACYSFN